MQLAVALYNNNVDDADELEFRKGDILTVLIENPHGFEGWWLCKHKEKCGLCPGNRLKLIQNSHSSPLKINDSLTSHLTPIPVISNHEYDNPHQSDFISDFKPIDSSSPESSSRSSGIYSGNELHLSCSSSDSYPTPISNKLFSSFELDQLEKHFQKLSIRSKLIHQYRQLIFQTPNETLVHLFINECHLFLQTYGYLLDRSSYKLIKTNLLYEFEHEKKQRISLARKILQIIELPLKRKLANQPFISNDVFQKLHLEPIDELPIEKLPTSHSSTQIAPKKRGSQTEMKTSKTCHSNFLNALSSESKDDYDYIDDDDEEKELTINPLIKCYYRHINEQVDSILKRDSFLFENENTISLLVTEGKKLVVSGHKLLFVLETLRDHSRQIQTSLTHLTTQLCEALTNLIQLLKQFSQQNCTHSHKPLLHFKYHIQMIMSIVKRIKQHCSVV